jgi:hypothetical protein
VLYTCIHRHYRHTTSLLRSARPPRASHQAARGVGARAARPAPAPSRRADDSARPRQPNAAGACRSAADRPHEPDRAAQPAGGRRTDPAAPLERGPPPPHRRADEQWSSAPQRGGVGARRGRGRGAGGARCRAARDAIQPASAGDHQPRRRLRLGCRRLRFCRRRAGRRHALLTGAHHSCRALLRSSAAARSARACGEPSARYSTSVPSSIGRANR